MKHTTDLIKIIIFGDFFYFFYSIVELGVVYTGGLGLGLGILHKFFNSSLVQTMKGGYFGFTLW